MSEEPKPAGEWTKDILDELSKRLPAGYHFGQLVADAHTTALDAAIAERITTRVLRLREEEVQPLVDALYDIAENDTYTGSERIYVAKQALAKVKAKP